MELNVNICELVLDELEVSGENEVSDFFDEVYSRCGNLTLLNSKEFKTSDALDVATFRLINENEIYENYKEKLLKLYSDYLDKMLPTMDYDC